MVRYSSRRMGMTDSLVFGDYILVGMFAWIIAQSLIVGDLLWLGISIALFNMYTTKRRGWDE